MPRISRYICENPLKLPRYLSSNNTGTFQDFTLTTNVFTMEEQKLLLSASLGKLDSMDAPSIKRRRKKYYTSIQSQMTADHGVANLFAPDEYYRFEEVCIRNHKFWESPNGSYFRVTLTASSDVIARCMFLHGLKLLISVFLPYLTDCRLCSPQPVSLPRP
jgi:hypothetical protein